MKKNEIRFIATENGINCEGNITLSPADKIKVDNKMEQVQNAAKECGATLSLLPAGIQLGFNVALSCDTKCINEADARMKCIIEQMREFISKLEPAKHENKPTTEFNIAVNTAFETLRKRFPDCCVCIVGANQGDKSIAMVGNIKPEKAALALLLRNKIAHEDD